MAQRIKALEDYCTLKTDMEELEDRVHTLESIVQRSTASYHLAASGGGSTDWTDTEIQIIQLKANLDKQIVALEAKRQEIDRYLERLDDNERRIIKARYMTGQKNTWTSISMKVPFSRSRCFDYHKKAIEKLWRWGLR